MATRMNLSAHADIADLEAARVDTGSVYVGSSDTRASFALFLGSGFDRGKTATLACLNRWVELVEALPDDEVTS